MTALRQFLTELRRRRVIRVLVLYAIAGWIIVQVASTVLPGLHVPQWSVTLVIVLVALGLPLAAVLAWAFDVGDDGLKRTAPSDISVGTVSAVPALASDPATPPVVAGAVVHPTPPPGPSVPSSATRRDPIRHSVAVLPFANLTGDATKDYLGQGLAEELIHTLASVPGLRVPARTSSFAYQGHNLDVRRIASELEVATVLEGSVRAAGEHIRISAQLIDGESGYHLWSEHYDRRFENLFEVQDELASAIVVQTLNAAMASSRPTTRLRATPTHSFEAYRIYLEALADTLSPGAGYRPAFDKLQQALRLDPDFAQARMALVRVRSLALSYGVPLPGTLADAEEDARQALNAHPESAATHAALGSIRAAQARWLEAEESYQQALALDDADPWTWHSHSIEVLGTMGHVRAQLSSAREAHRLAPAWFGAHINLAAANALMGHDDQASSHAQVACDLGVQRTSLPLADILSQVDLHAGRYEAARALMLEAVRPVLKAPRAVGAVDCVFDAFAGTASRSAAIAALDGLRAEVGDAGLNQIIRIRLITWYSMLGAYDQAYEVMNRSLDDFAAWGTVGLTWGFLWLKELKGFRDDARFATLAARMRLPDYWQRHGPPDGYDLLDGRLVAR